VEASNPYLFDWRQLRQWRIDESRLPPGSVVRFRELSVWDLYRHYIVLAVILIATQSLLIVALLVQRSRRQRAEDDARARREELTHAQRVATMGELSASLAHEINQPLSAIVTNAQVARRLVAGPREEDSELTAALADIADDAWRAATIVRRLRTLVHKRPGERRLVDVNAAVTEVTRILRRDLARSDVALQAHLGEALPPVNGDAVQLQQVVLNLLLNACQAMTGAGDGARVLRVETSEPAPGRVEIAVADTGPGLTARELERMFEPFVSSKTGGLGMGLSISRSIVEAHGGHIRATRNPGRGLTLRVTLPGAPAAHVATRPALGPPAPDERSPVAEASG
jgi:C4-dicarboxylate-specific signal transduction histidine kinase